jgi:hypothetical protein
VGERTRCWFGNQFSLTAPRFACYGVDLWVPELGGRFDALNPSHKMRMSILGGMSESERQHVQARVRASALRPERNRHRIADGRQGSTVRAILENPRYTGYAFFGRWTRTETLIVPGDVAAGNVVRSVGRSPAHLLPVHRADDGARRRRIARSSDVRITLTPG